MTAPNAAFDALLSTTLAKYGKKLVDNVFLDRPLTWWLTEKNNVETEDGGESIVVQLMHAQNSTVSSYAGYDALDLTPQEGITAAKFPWRQFAGSIAISGIEEAKNAGEARLINLLSSKVMQLEESLKEKLNQMSFLDGSGNGGKDFYGLANLVSATTAVGGINPATSGSEFWKSVAFAMTGSGDALIRSNAVWTHQFNTASKGNDRPGLILTTQDLWEHFEASMHPSVRYTDTLTANAGFNNVTFKNVPVVYDAYCQAGTTYMLNSKYISMKGMKGRWFYQTPFKTVPDRDARWANILTYGNMVVSNRARHAVITNQTIA